jgi:hypothetical protein
VFLKKKIVFVFLVHEANPESAPAVNSGLGANRPLACGEAASKKNAQKPHLFQRTGMQKGNASLREVRTSVSTAPLLSMPSSNTKIVFAGKPLAR